MWLGGRAGGWSYKVVHDTDVPGTILLENIQYYFFAAGV